MLEFTLGAHAAKRIGSVYDALEAKAVRGLPFDCLFVEFIDGALVVTASDRFTMIEAAFDNIEFTGDAQRKFALSPAQAKALKSLKTSEFITIRVDEANRVTTRSNGAYTEFEFDAERLESTVAKFTEILNAKFAMPEAGSSVAIDLTRIAGLAKLPSDWRVSFIGELEPVRFAAPGYRALIQAKRTAR
jgi:hypothetical protein